MGKYDPFNHQQAGYDLRAGTPVYAGQTAPGFQASQQAASQQAAAQGGLGQGGPGQVGAATLSDVIQRLVYVACSLGDVEVSLDRSGDRLRGACPVENITGSASASDTLLDQLASLALDFEQRAARLSRAAERISQTLS